MEGWFILYGFVDGSHNFHRVIIDAGNRDERSHLWWYRQWKVPPPAITQLSGISLNINPPAAPPPFINSCLVRIPGTINSKCGQTVKVVQRWDGQRPAINYLLRDFRRWLINEKLEQYRHTKRVRPQTINSTTISWIEKLLQTPLDDYRKFVVWRILSPYLINIRKCSVEEASNIIKNWLDKCNQLRSLDFNPNYMIKYNINSANRMVIYQ